ncbi:ATP-dependent RNA helicase eIF4A [Histomonas meleagridis]|uniref:ATP-dependent RNA helicase eIF4A n=1 Tax=Histomonas meleagridis TaxID=135588 RepID=UPI0035593F16|nr:ATP-dependent RNA helicase eIF4A [Histomonas meleagridis]KAH0797947.1 ATP-dependent RNA helicase eIF4A [Histomonas meleagridis]
MHSRGDDYSSDRTPRNNDKRGQYRGRRGRTGRQIQRSDFVPKDFETNWTQEIDDFDQMELNEDLLHGIFSYGFKNPSPIQSLAIQPIIMGRHVIAQAQSGTGKTGAFSIGILQEIDTSKKTTQALILSPTRELATQTFMVMTSIGSRIPNLTVDQFIGGSSVQEDCERASKFPHVVVATPGRALNLIQDGYLRCEKIKIVCVDEADEMLSGGFIEQIQEIFSYFDPTIQILLFSATIPGEIFELMKQFMRDPIKILVRSEQLTLEGISQYFVNVNDPKYKFPTLLDIYGRLSIQKAIIFANRKQTVDYLQHEFEKEKFDVSAIHSGLLQAERAKIMQQFRTGNTRVLISTDLLARGIDVQQVTLVINFELPYSAEQYLHRIGRSGRYGRKGVAFNIIDSTEVKLLRDIEDFYHTKIEELPQNFEDIVNEANESVNR